MADSFKLLNKHVAANAAPTQYSPGAGKSWIIKHMSFTNITGGAVTLTVYRNGTTAGTDTFLPSFSIPANTVTEWDGTLCLGPTDTLAFLAGAATSIVVMVDGDEVS